jgi:hypothetical protein
MIHVESLPLPDDAQIQLDEYQSQVDAKPTYKAQVKKAKLFSRGEWTIECLGLNKREVLVKSRNEAFNNYMARLETYRAKQNNAPEEKLQKMINGIKTMAHPTVWQEMVRQHHEHDELRDLFEVVPEAIEW